MVPGAAFDLAAYTEGPLKGPPLSWDTVLQG